MSNPQYEQSEHRWQQPAFGPQPTWENAQPAPVVIPQPMPLVTPPPSSGETLVRTLLHLVWPVMLVVVYVTGVSLWTGIALAVIATVVLKTVRERLRRQRLLPTPPAQPPVPDLR